MFRLSIFIVSLFSLIACKSSTSIDVFSEDKLLTSITDEATQVAIKKAFEQKQAVVFKRMPQFEYRIIFSDDDKKEEWLLSKLGVIKSVDEGSPTYKVDIDIEAILKSSEK